MSLAGLFRIVGRYGIAAAYSDGKSESTTKLNTYVEARVQSVTVGTDGLYLDLPGLGTAPLDYVLRIR